MTMLKDAFTLLEPLSFLPCTIFLESICSFGFSGVLSTSGYSKMITTAAASRMMTAPYTAMALLRSIDMGTLYQEGGKANLAI